MNGANIRYNLPTMRNHKTKELNQLVISIELTLISVVQGLALAALAQSAIDPMTHFRYEFIPYIISGMLLVMYFWAQAIMHTISFIRWPINFAHSFLYFIALLFEVLVFSQMTNPSGWFIFTSGFFLVAWILYLVDLGPLDTMRKAATTTASKALFVDLCQEHRRSLYFFIPFGLIYNLVAWLLVVRYPALFIERQGHLVLSFGQVVFGLVTILQGLKKYPLRATFIEELVDE